MALVKGCVRLPGWSGRALNGLSTREAKASEALTRNLAPLRVLHPGAPASQTTPPGVPAAGTTPSRATGAGLERARAAVPRVNRPAAACIPSSTTKVLAALRRPHPRAAQQPAAAEATPTAHTRTTRTLPFRRQQDCGHRCRRNAHAATACRTPTKHAAERPRYEINSTQSPVSMAHGSIHTALAQAGAAGALVQAAAA